MKPRLIDFKALRRAFASTPSKPCVLTTDGLIYDNVHYRFERAGITRTLSSNLHRTPFADRLEGTAKILVVPRVWDDDLDMIEVPDETNGAYIEMWSTEPGYTHKLTRWEHHAYQKLLRQGGDGARSKRDRQRNKAKHLNGMHKTLTGKSFNEREHYFGLLEGEEARLSGARAANPECADVPELRIPTDLGGIDRQDVPAPPPQKAASEDAEDQAVEEDDVRSDPKPRIAEETGEPEIDDNPAKRSRWDFSDDEDDEEGD